VIHRALSGREARALRRSRAARSVAPGRTGVLCEAQAVAPISRLAVRSGVPMASPRSLDRKAIAWHLPDALAQLSRGQPTARSLRIRDTISGIPERLGGTSRAVARGLRRVARRRRSGQAAGTCACGGPPESIADCVKQSPCASGSGLKYFHVPMHYPMPPSTQEETRESTLSWFIRALNSLEPKERRELLRQILGTSD
jgi:hypothetical protein